MVADEVLCWFSTMGTSSRRPAATSTTDKHADVFRQSLEQRDARLLYNEYSDEAWA
jgi:hypothetical protein